CADSKVEALSEALQTTVQQWRGRFPRPLPLELYTSSSFIGLFVEEQVADVLRQFAADFATEAARKTGRNHQGIVRNTPWVMYPYMPQNDDELELAPGDYIFTSSMDQTSTSEGWVYGTSLATGLSGLLPENYVSLADESDTWVFHG
ncbi:hypothetical protein GOODEAATRI_005871, partial [Goodea atripinnis]